MGAAASGEAAWTARCAHRAAHGLVRAGAGAGAGRLGSCACTCGAGRAGETDERGLGTSGARAAPASRVAHAGATGLSLRALLSAPDTSTATRRTARLLKEAMGAG